MVEGAEAGVTAVVAGILVAAAVGIPEALAGVAAILAVAAGILVAVGVLAVEIPGAVTRAAEVDTFRVAERT